MHHFWDTEFVVRLGADPRQVAASIIDGISDQQRQAWSAGKASDWAIEAFELAGRDAYRRLPEPGTNDVYALDANYVDVAVEDVRMQLGRAGVRLALVLNETLGHEQ